MQGETYGALRLTTHFDPREVRDAWLALQAHGVGTFFQSYEWHSTWARAAAAAAGETPLIVAAWDQDGALAAILPFAVRQRFGQRSLVWMAQSASAYNMGLFRRDASAWSGGAWDPRRMLDAVRKTDPSIAFVHLSGQPARWDGMQNPFAALDTQVASGPVYGIGLSSSFEDLTLRFSGRRRNRHRRSLRKLESAGVTFESITDPVERLRAFQEFVRQKSHQLGKRGAANMYETPAIADLYARLLTGAQTRERFVVYAAKQAERYLAVSIGVRQAQTYFDIMLSMDAGELEQLSPGFLMVSRVVENECEAGTGRFDFGPGLTELKSTWQAEPLERFDTILSLRTVGLPAASMKRARFAIERGIRSQPTLLKAAKLVRRGLAAVGRRGLAVDASDSLWQRYSEGKPKRLAQVAGADFVGPAAGVRCGAGCRSRRATTSASPQLIWRGGSTAEGRADDRHAAPIAPGSRSEPSKQASPVPSS